MISTSTLNRDFEKHFLSFYNLLKKELQDYVKASSRISITTNAQSTQNYKEFIIVTRYQINKGQKQRSQLLNIVHFKDLIYSREYFANQLVSITNDFNITKYIFTITRDNAKLNNTMLDLLEAIIDQQRYEKLDNLQQPQSFTQKESDVRYIRHVINIAVQAILTSLKAILANETDSYQIIYKVTQLLVNYNKIDVVFALAKLRRYIYIFRNRRL